MTIIVVLSITVSTTLKIVTDNVKANNDGQCLDDKHVNTSTKQKRDRDSDVCPCCLESTTVATDCINCDR